MKKRIAMVLLVLFLFVVWIYWSPRFTLPLSTDFVCNLKLAKKTYKKGERIQAQVRIENRSEQWIYLIGSLDGSEGKIRYPHAYFQLIRLPNDTIDLTALGCGNVNRLSANDFVYLAPKDSFDPFMQQGALQFFSSYLPNYTLDSAGIYQLQFFYSSETMIIEDFGEIGWDLLDKVRVKRQLNYTPRITLQTESIQFKVF